MPIPAFYRFSQAMDVFPESPVQSRFAALGRLADHVLKGLSQVMLQEHRVTGLLFLLGLLVGSWVYALAAFVSSITGTLLAGMFRFGKKELEAGIYGFSPALVGIALCVFFEPTPLLWGMIVVGALAAAGFQHLFLRLRIPGYTFPFIVVTWLLYYLLHHSGAQSPSALTQPFIPITDLPLLWAGSNGFGQVMFQSSRLVGLLFLLGVFRASPVAAVYGLAASFIGALIAFGAGQPMDQIQTGLFGFNAVLTAIAFSGKERHHAFWAGLGVLLSLAIQLLLASWKGLEAVGGALTFPFVAATWLTLFFQKLIRKRL